MPASNGFIDRCNEVIAKGFCKDRRRYVAFSIVEMDSEPRAGRNHVLLVFSNGSIGSNGLQSNCEFCRFLEVVTSPYFTNFMCCCFMFDLFSNMNLLKNVFEECFLFEIRNQLLFSSMPSSFCFQQKLGNASKHIVSKKVIVSRLILITNCHGSHDLSYSQKGLND